MKELKKRRLAIVVIIILGIVSFIKFTEINDDEYKVTEKDLMKYQNVTNSLNHGIQRYINDKGTLPEDNIFRTLILEGYANI